ncbi:hypothetical protein M406DRAFT_327544 [Cryphonectria parasitica EP155]|uniref:Uncharacterized protein n=1 Tax=Cryphonectria parasitica (strain ATCC 38755 / EP155) TaxID=660469 RepID=A0A9P4YAM0_CRYP1|nr:uncharacterized protein M406DRAFT_327544 [Cryphonectria parasitica EP155]KAF3769140.1 hypothetical protein M406DRAFT_327544 [Cryphonectria parasitica EP155]
MTGSQERNGFFRPGLPLLCLLYMSRALPEKVPSCRQGDIVPVGSSCGYMRWRVCQGGGKIRQEAAIRGGGEHGTLALVPTARGADLERKLPESPPGKGFLLEGEAVCVSWYLVVKRADHGMEAAHQRYGQGSLFPDPMVTSNSRKTWYASVCRVWRPVRD